MQEHHGQKNKDAHALAAGHIVLAWNEYQEVLGETFGLLFGRDHYALAISAWQALDNDRAQRHMLKAVAERKLGSDDKIYTELKWLLDQTDQMISQQRNVGIHAPLMSFTDADGTHYMLPQTYYGNKKAQRLVGIDIIAEYAHYASQIRKLTSFAIGLESHIDPYGATPDDWPERPALTSRPPATA